MLNWFGMKVFKLTKTLIIKRTLMKAPFNYKTPKALLKDYKEFKGSLMHLITKTKSDIYYAVSQLGQFLNNPINKHYTQLKRVFRYIKSIINIKIVYKRDRNIIINI